MKSRLSSFLVGLPLTLVVVQPQAMETQNCDAVIIGAGGSGISAAITLKEAGKQHVCLVEKCRSWVVQQIWLQPTLRS